VPVFLERRLVNLSHNGRGEASASPRCCVSAECGYRVLNDQAVPPFASVVVPTVFFARTCHQ
jgi:hypothetical protein